MDFDLEYRKIMELLGELHELRKVLSGLADAIRNPAKDEWLHITDVCKIFKKSERTIYRWEKKKDLKSRIFGGAVYFLKSELFKLPSA